MQAETPDEVRHALLLFQNYFAFTKSLGGLVHLGDNGTFAGFNHVVNASYPDAWLHQYWKNGFADVDPVFKSALQSPRARHWQSIYQHRPLLSEKEQGFLAAACRFGLLDGITTESVDHPCGFATFCSFASEHMLEGGRLIPLVEYFGHYIHMALLRTAPKTVPTTDRCINTLSLREITILNWMKNGKTNWEIGKILGVSERTIRFHIESIFTKLEVTSRSQAVATAIEHGLPALHGLPSPG